MIAILLRYIRYVHHHYLEDIASHMDLAYAFVADAAQFTDDGKLWVLGGDFDTIYSPTYPVAQPVLTLVVKLFARPADCNREHALLIDFAMPDGGAARLATQSFTPQLRADRPDLPDAVNLALGFLGLTFSVPGAYTLRVVVDDAELAAVPLHLLQAEGPLRAPAS